jgi:excisionase family DNA binding protein
MVDTQPNVRLYGRFFVTEYDQVLTPAEVARIFHVDAKTVSRWADQGLLSSFKTPGGHHRFHASQVRALMTPQVNVKSQGENGE